MTSRSSWKQHALTNCKRHHLYLHHQVATVSRKAFFAIWGRTQVRVWSTSTDEVPSAKTDSSGKSSSLRHLVDPTSNCGYCLSCAFLVIVLTTWMWELSQEYLASRKRSAPDLSVVSESTICAADATFPLFTFRYSIVHLFQFSSHLVTILRASVHCVRGARRRWLLWAWMTGPVCPVLPNWFRQSSSQLSCIVKIEKKWQELPASSSVIKRLWKMESDFYHVPMSIINLAWQLLSPLGAGGLQNVVAGYCTTRAVKAQYKSRSRSLRILGYKVGFLRNAWCWLWSSRYRWPLN